MNLAGKCPIDKVALESIPSLRAEEIRWELLYQYLTWQVCCD